MRVVRALSDACRLTDKIDGATACVVWAGGQATLRFTALEWWHNVSCGTPGRKPQGTYGSMRVAHPKTRRRPALMTTLLLNCRRREYLL